MDQHSNECDLDHIYEVPQYGDGMKPQWTSTAVDQHSKECDLDYIYEVPQYGDGMKPNDYEHYYEPTAAN